MWFLVLLVWEGWVLARFGKVEWRKPNLLLILTWILLYLCFCFRTKLTEVSSGETDVPTCPQWPLHSCSFLMKLKIFTCNTPQSQDPRTAGHASEHCSECLINPISTDLWLIQKLQRACSPLGVQLWQGIKFPYTASELLSWTFALSDYNHCNTESSSAAVNYSNWICTSVLALYSLASGRLVENH